MGSFHLYVYFIHGGSFGSYLLVLDDQSLVYALGHPTQLLLSITVRVIEDRRSALRISYTEEASIGLSTYHPFGTVSYHLPYLQGLICSFSSS